MFLSGARAQDGYVFTTLAGKAGEFGARDGGNASARFNRPLGIAVERSDDLVVVDSGNATLRRVTPDSVSTIAGRAGETGSTDGEGAEARFGFDFNPPFIDPLTGRPSIFGPEGVAIDLDGSIIVADTIAATIRRVVDRQVTTIAGEFFVRFSINSPGYRPKRSVDGSGSAARFVTPWHVAIDAAGVIFVSDTNVNTIRKIDGAVVTTYAGANGVEGSNDGRRLEARFKRPAGLTIAPDGSLFVVDSGNFTVRKISAAGDVSTVAGSVGERGSRDGRAVDSRFGGVPTPDIPLEAIVLSLTPVAEGPIGITALSDGSVLVCDTRNHTIRRISPTGVVSTVGGVAGTSGSADGPSATARFMGPSAIAADRNGTIYISDTGNHVIRKGVPAYRPRFEIQPADGVVTPGQPLQIRATTAANDLPITYQWHKDGGAISGATTATLTITNASAMSVGRYTLVASNALGEVSSNPAFVTLLATPRIVTAPSRSDVRGGEPLELTVSATGDGVLGFQWHKDGQPIPGATRATYSVGSAQASDAGEYWVVVTNAGDSVSSAKVGVTVNTARLANLSIRTPISPAAPTLIVGFVVSGADKPLLIRAAGPALRQFGLTSVLDDPRFSVYQGASVVGVDDNWSAATNAGAVAVAASRVGAFALAPGSLDAALLEVFAGGAYSVQTSGASNSSGVVLVELYDANSSTAPRLVNVSTRAYVATGDDVLVAGFVVTGNAEKTLLIRAVGPTLVGFGVAQALADPRLDIIATGKGVIASNDNWGGDVAIAATFTSQGAFPLAANSKDSVLLVTLAPGSYSAQVSGVGATTGEALVEIYDVR